MPSVLAGSSPGPGPGALFSPIGFRFITVANCHSQSILARVLLETLTETRSGWALTNDHMWNYVEVPEQAAQLFLEPHSVDGRVLTSGAAEDEVRKVRTYFVLLCYMFPRGRSCCIACLRHT